MNNEEKRINGGDSEYTYQQKNLAEGVIIETSHDGTVVKELITVHGGEHNTKYYCNLLNSTTLITISRECAERRLTALQEQSDKDGGLMCAEVDDEEELKQALSNV